MFRKRKTWWLLGLAVAGSLWFTARFFTQAWPVVQVRLTMGRSAALSAARELALQHGWGPSNGLAAAAFEVDEDVRNFVELEAGGKPAFAKLLGSELYAPFVWRVRLFREQEINETTVWFRPDGRPWGFEEHIPEELPGASLPPTEARHLAESMATGCWAVPLADYDCVEASQEEQRGGRTDHVFVYEHRHERLGEGRLRLRLVVSGDRLTALQRFVKVPESFARRYEAMRSHNKLIGDTAEAVIAIVYGGAGCLLGLVLLLRRRALLWKQALVWAGLIGMLQAASALNVLPLAWMEYDTAQSRAGFVFQHIAGAMGTALLWFVVTALTFMVAESLTRRALPHVVQFWRVWRPRVAASPEIAGQTLGGYALAVLFLGYEVLLYLFCNRTLGWWSPSDTLMDPNIVAMPVPWLSPLASALEAGFWEECLFRAVPLAWAILISRRLGHRRLVVGLTLVLQAVVFGAGHATYAQQPAYARVVELTPAFIGFGLVYLRFGLLPVIVAHFAYDFALMAFPLFFTDAPGMWVHRIASVLVLLVPAGVILWARFIRGTWCPVHPEERNAAWAPGPRSSERPQAKARAATAEFSGAWVGVAVIMGLLGLGLCLSLTRFDHDAKPLELTRAEAVTRARAVLRERGWEVSDRWTIQATIEDEPGESERFVWKEYGPDVYWALVDAGYLMGPRWRVRFACFDPAVPLTERAEHYEVWISDSGDVDGLRHALPEGRAGPDLTREDAERVAARFLRTVGEEQETDPARWREVAAGPEKHPHRTDWSFTYSTDEFAGFTNNEPRLRLRISGDQVVSVIRHFHVPEDYRRQAAEEDRRKDLMRGISGGGLLLLVLGALVWAIVGWSRGQLDRRVFWRLAIVLGAAGLIQELNAWPSRVAQFSTAEPFAHQVVTTVLGTLVTYVLVVPVLALIAGWALRQSPPWPRARSAVRWLGVSLGVFLAGFRALVYAFAEETGPYWPTYEALEAQVPWLAATLSELLPFVLRTVLLQTVLLAADRLTVRGRAGALSAGVLLTSMGVMLVGYAGPTDFRSWLLQGATFGLLLVLLYRRLLHGRPDMVPVMLAASAACEALHLAVVAPHPGARLGYGLGGAVLIGLGWLWSGWTTRDDRRMVPPPLPVEPYVPSLAQEA